MICDNPQCKKDAAYTCPYCDKNWCSQHLIEDDGIAKCPNCGNHLEPLSLREKFDLPYTEPFR